MNDVLGYAGKRVIVSGCFSGMGEATAKLLLDLGAEVHGLDFKPSKLPLASFSTVDLRDPASIEAGVAGLGGGKIDALFNCAGLPNSFAAIDVMRVNFIGLRHLTQAVLPLMSAGGAIANIASTGGLGWSRRIPDNMAFVTTPGWDEAIAWCEANMDTVGEGYAFSKENVIVWTQFMGASLIKQGIRINCTLPSPTQTPMMAEFHKTSGKEVVDAAAEPMGRYSTPAEQAGGLVLLNSDLASIVNGVVLPVDGGFMGGLATGQIDISKMMRRAQPVEGDMNFALTAEQEMVRDSFARFLDDNCTGQHLRAAQERGFDPALWQGLAELGAFGLRVPEDAGGLGLGTFDAAVVMEEIGRTLAPGPIAEAILAARLVAMLGGDASAIVAGETVASLALHDAATMPRQFVAGGGVAAHVVARRGDAVVLFDVPASARPAEPSLASDALAEIDFASANATVLAEGADALAQFAATVEEWKLLVSAALAGLGRQALKIAAEYATERKQFGQPIGQFQGISHPLADRLCDVDGGKLLTWRTLRDIADGAPGAAAHVSLTAWWNAQAAGRAVSQALHTFGGYGLTTEYDIHLYNLRARSLPLVWGDPARWLEEAGARRYGNESVPLPDVGDLPIEFDIGEEARAMIAEIDAFMAANVTPDMRAKFHYSWEGWNPGLHKKLAEAGLLFLSSPALGGRGIGPYAKSAARGAFERHRYNNPAAGVAEMVGLMIAKAGSDELKRDVLSRIVSGEAIASLGYSEPGSGSDVFAAQTKATPDGPIGSNNRGWRIDGTKMFTSGANLSEYVLMLTRTNPDVPKHKGLTMFIVPLKAEGVTIQPVHTFQDERTNITFYDNVKIPDSWRLGEVDGGVRTMSLALELEHGGSFAKPMRETLNAAEELCGEIEAPSGGKLIDQPQTRARLARAHASIIVSELFEYRATWASAEKQSNLGFGPMAKMFSSEKFLDDARDLLDLTAPLSLTKRDGAAALLNQSYRHAHGTRIYGGTSEVHRSMIAERGLGLPRTRS